MSQSFGNVSINAGKGVNIKGDAFVNKSSVSNYVVTKGTTSMDTQAETPGGNAVGQALFHKEADDSFFYDDLKPYFKADVNKSIGSIEVKDDGHGTCFRVGAKLVMTAYHVIGSNDLNACSVKFEDDSWQYQISNCEFDDEERDFIILELQVDDPTTLPKHLDLNDRLCPKGNIFGYPGEKRLRIDIGCPVYTDRPALENDKSGALKYWRNTYPDKDFQKGFGILENRTALHSSRTFEHGASGGPIFGLDGGKPVVMMMYQGGTPETYYQDEEVQIGKHPMKYRFEYGITMNDIKEILQKKRKSKLIEDIFRN